MNVVPLPFNKAGDPACKGRTPLLVGKQWVLETQWLCMNREVCRAESEFSTSCGLWESCTMWQWEFCDSKVGHWVWLDLWTKNRFGFRNSRVVWVPRKVLSGCTLLSLRHTDHLFMYLSELIHKHSGLSMGNLFITTESLPLWIGQPTEPFYPPYWW